MPPVNHHVYAAARQGMIDEILNSNTLETYLIVSNQLYGAPRVTVMHSLFRYSAGFGGTNALHGKIVGMLGETVGGQLPPLIRFRDDDVEVDFASALMLENVNVQPAAAVTAYFEGPAAREVMPAVTIAAGAVATNLSCLCPIPLAWAPYFLDFKKPYEAYRMGTRLVGTTMTTDAERLRMEPLLIWLRACTQRQGAPAAHQGLSILDQIIMDATPAPLVTLEITVRLQHFRLPALVPPAQPAGAGQAPAALVPAGTSTAAGEYTELESEILMSSCGITDAEWTTDVQPPTMPWHRYLRSGTMLLNSLNSSESNKGWSYSWPDRRRRLRRPNNIFPRSALRKALAAGSDHPIISSITSTATNCGSTGHKCIDLYPSMKVFLWPVDPQFVAVQKRGHEHHGCCGSR
jgi:hypothetical protein